MSTSHTHLGSLQRLSGGMKRGVRRWYNAVALATANCRALPSNDFSLPTCGYWSSRRGKGRGHPPIGLPSLQTGGHAGAYTRRNMTTRAICP